MRERASATTEKRGRMRVVRARKKGVPTVIEEKRVYYY